MAHYQAPHQDQHVPCLKIQLFSSLVLKRYKYVSSVSRYSYDVPDEILMEIFSYLIRTITTKVADNTTDNNVIVNKLAAYKDNQ